MGFNFEEAFKRPTKIINDAAMQALGSYRNGKMLFLGLGTGLGSTLIADGILEPMELGHLPYKKGTYEDYVGDRGLRQFGKKQWRRHVADVVARLIAALEPTDVVIGGGMRFAASGNMPLLLLFISFFRSGTSCVDRSRRQRVVV